jgi:predicted aspartyl protease
MQLILRDSLPRATPVIENAGKRLEVPDNLVDTGSASTLLSVDIADQVDIHPSPSNRLYIIRGVGGQEVVYSRKIDRIGVGQTSLPAFKLK